MHFIDRFIKALIGLKPRKRTIFDDIEDARRNAGLPRVVHNYKKWV